MSRRRTTLLATAIAVAGALVLSACQSNAGAAAVIGSQQITDEELRAGIDQGLAVQGIRDKYQGNLGEYRRSFLFKEINHRLVQVAAQRNGVRVDEAEVQRQIQGTGVDAIVQSTELPPSLAERYVRDLLTLVELGYIQGTTARTTDAVLREEYKKVAAQNATAQLGIIALPDPASVQQVLAELQQHPDRFKALADKYPNSAADPTPIPVGRIPESVRGVIATAEPGTLVPYVSPQSGEFLVVKVFSVDLPPFDQVRPQLVQSVLSRAEREGEGYLAKVAREVGVRVNPRYGSWDVDKAQITDLPGLPGTRVPPPAAPAAPPAATGS